MALIDGYLTAIKNADRGEDVRDTIINCLKKINDDNPSTIKPLNVTANGTYTGSGGIVYNPVTVNVPEGTSNAISLESIKITENGDYEPDDGKAYSSITVDVPLEEMEIMDELVVTANGEYEALLDGYDGYGKVTVNVQSGGTGTYTVTFVSSDGSTVYGEVVGVPAGGGATYYGTTPTSSGMRFIGWSPNPTNIQKDTTCYARFENITYDDSQITDDWITIAKNVRNDPDYYSIGQWKLLELNELLVANQTDVTKLCTGNSSDGRDFGSNGVNDLYLKMRLIAKGVDPLEGENGYAPTTWMSMNAIPPLYYYPSGDAATWTGHSCWLYTQFRAFLQGQFTTVCFPQTLLPYVRRVIKYSKLREYTSIIGTAYPSIEWFWIPSLREMYGNASDASTVTPTYMISIAADMETTGPVYDIYSPEDTTYADAYANCKAANYSGSFVNVCLRTNTSGYIFGSAVSTIVIQGQDGKLTGVSNPNALSSLIGFCL